LKYKHLLFKFGFWYNAGMANPKRPRDVNQLAKYIVDISVGETTETPESKKAAAGKLGGLKGGKARAAALTPEQRSEIAKKAAETRWNKKSD
jgi:hypothetical protein